MDNPVTAHRCAESEHYREESNRLRALLGQLDASNERLVDERDHLRARVAELEQDIRIACEFTDECRETWSAQLALAESQRDGVVAELQKTKADRDDADDSAWRRLIEIDRLTNERDSALARLAAVERVYRAAVEWSESFGELSKRLPPHVHKLRNAVDAALNTLDGKAGGANE